MTAPISRHLMAGIIGVMLLAAGLYAWQSLNRAGWGPQFISGNGRIEATEIDVAAKLPGRLVELVVNDGDFVIAGQLLGHMQDLSLQAQRDEALAMRQQAISVVASAEAMVAVRQSDYQAVLALVAQREAELDAAQRRLNRSELLAREGASSEQELDDDRGRVRGIHAAIAAARAQAAAARSAIDAARTQASGARASVAATQATIARIEVDIADSALLAPRAGRIQYLIAQPGEVLGGGDKVLNLVDLDDVYMTFFVPEQAAGKLPLGAPVRLVLDAAPQFVIPAQVSFVASNAQFTPKTVETASERQKLMFRVKAQIDPSLLRKHRQLVKTGLPGVAWVRLDPRTPWPAALTVRVPQ
ncbi:HlyD family efflux transporter periplasmic adaptor subunit [Janthinobacterium sp. J1-1]|uniref:HlyD family secretion protein n=1 Tax=Janthinobacterium sp. J1-1 TaxID=3065910 RepID=UPI002810BF27|nr:HlyD family efflux transporter periplasmic adaptor subunit [Janthinobacterium sp. J1-1]